MSRTSDRTGVRLAMGWVGVLATWLLEGAFAGEPQLLVTIDTDAAGLAHHESLQRFRHPVAFVKNHGQWPEAVRFASRLGHSAISIERGALGVSFGEGETRVAARLVFEGAREHAVLEGEGTLRGTYGFVRGRDRARWRTGVPSYSSVLIHSLYECIHLRMREGKGEGAGRMEYDFLLEPGADLEQVVVRCEGAEDLSIDSDGSLRIRARAGDFRQRPPIAWQEGPRGDKRFVACRYRILSDDRFGFDAPDIDPELPLVIDPILEAATLYGGSGNDTPWDVAVDAAGNVVIVGWTTSGAQDLPLGDPVQEEPGGGIDAFIARFDPALGDLLSATFIGGTADDRALSVTLDEAGNILVAGQTASEDFPTTPGALQERYVGGMLDAFLLRLSPDGNELT